MYGEARGESDVGKRAVAHVVLNRAKNSERTTCGLVHEHGQFKPKSYPKDFRVDIQGKDPTDDGAITSS